MVCYMTKTSYWYINLTICLVAGINKIIDVRSDHEIISSLELNIGFGW